ncbi:MAG: uridine kinase [Deltaproteobacteria bacterium]|nr:uridine kinase [Deltaproteobacteria bacterium]
MHQPLILGIAGGTGSGKTTVAKAIIEALTPSAALIDHDAYYRDQSHLGLEERGLINYDHPDSLETELLIEHLQQLRGGRAIEKPIYDYTQHARSSHTLRIDPAPVIVVEGILTLAVPALRDQFDVKVFVDTDADIRLMRRIRRDLEQRGRSFASIRAQYYGTVRPMHLAFVEPSKRFADVIIPEGGENRIGVDVLVGRIRLFLRESLAPGPGS